jgi:hypothetical protein
LKTYLVFEPAGGSRNAEAADAVRFVREKFYWSALIFAPLWLIWHRLWLGFAAWLVACLLIAGFAYGFGLEPASAAVAQLLPSLVVAFEGAELRRGKLLRTGYREAGAAIGDDLEDAERRFFAGWDLRADAAPPTKPEPRPAASPPLQSPAPNTVLGLFPEPGGRR